MKKKDIGLLVFAIIFLIVAIIFFFVSSNIQINKKSVTPKVSNEVKGTLENNTTNSVNNVTSNTLNEADYQKAAETGILNPVAEYKDFSVYDENGNVVSLDSFSGKPVFILFWQVSELDSVEMLKVLNDVYTKYSEKVIFLSVTDLASKADAQKIVQDNNIQVPIYYEENSAGSTAYNVTNYPTAIIKDKNNNIVNQKVGQMEEDTILANLDILSENY